MTSNTCGAVDSPVALYYGEELARYGFGHGHPFGTDRLDAFWSEVRRTGLDKRVGIASPVRAERREIEYFHSASYVDLVESSSKTGAGYLDHGDTPAYKGVYESASDVVGTTLDAVGRLVNGGARRAFVPIAGLHHARRGSAGGFCVFNDCGVAIEVLRRRYGIHRIAYVDIDAHHGDGVLYGFEDDAGVVIGDIHEDGRFLYPGTGWAHETGRGDAEGTKLNIPLPPGAGDDVFFAAWERLEAHIETSRPEFVLLQCGADCLAADPLTHLEFTKAAHRHAASRLCAVADRHSNGRILAMGGGGYNHRNIADAWCEVVEAFLDAG
jgi:acetoin utilization protein AcuC